MNSFNHIFYNAYSSVLKMADLRINTGTRIPFHLCLGILYVTHFLKKYSQEILKGICFILYKNVCK